MTPTDRHRHPATLWTHLPIAIALVLIMTLVLAAMFHGLALASTGGADGDPAGWLRAAYDAILAGNWKIAVGGGLSLIVYGLRVYSDKPLPIFGFRIPLPSWFRTRRGGVVLVLVLAYGTGIAHGLLVDAAITPALFIAAAQVALAAIGGYEGLRALWSQSPPKPSTPPTATLPLR